MKVQRWVVTNICECCGLASVIFEYQQTLFRCLNCNEVYYYADKDIEALMKTTDFPMPDPSWDYFDRYCLLWKAKSQVDAAIKEISQFEDADPTCDEVIERLVYSARQVLIEIEESAKPSDNF
jgi:hypothetical protein